MASLEDYDEFGNYIGADLESDEEDEIAQDPYISGAHEQELSHAPLEGFDDEQPHDVDSMALMEIDGQPHCHIDMYVVSSLHMNSCRAHA